jgi:hypothetical protein
MSKKKKTLLNDALNDFFLEKNKTFLMNLLTLFQFITKIVGFTNVLSSSLQLKLPRMTLTRLACSVQKM